MVVMKFGLRKSKGKNDKMNTPGYRKLMMSKSAGD